MLSQSFSHVETRGHFDPNSVHPPTYLADYLPSTFNPYIVGDNFSLCWDSANASTPLYRTHTFEPKDFVLGPIDVDLPQDVTVGTGSSFSSSSSSPSISVAPSAIFSPNLSEETEIKLEPQEPKLDGYHTICLSAVQEMTNPQSKRRNIKTNPLKHAFKVFPRENQNRLRELLLQEVLLSQWWANDELEPDRKILHQFFKRGGSKWFECLACRKKLSRIDRAVDHFRTHIAHRPFICLQKRGCGDQNCASRFFTKDCLNSHHEKKEKKCETCGASVEDKNLTRHQKTRKCQRTATRH